MVTCPVCSRQTPDGFPLCANCGAPLDDRKEAHEERKLATLLFADLVGSTQLGEQDPERTRALLDRFYDAMADEIERAGGTVEKFVGDAVMAAFGAPVAHEDDPERALHAALGLQRRMQELFDGELQLRIGVNTGEVVVGPAREGSSFVTGDAVNVSARLEQHAAPGEILVGERTVAAVRGAFEFDEPRAIDAKGKREPVACRRLVRALTLMRPRGIGGLRPAFVGRETELDLLQATYRRAVRDGGPHLVTIMGDAGVGKSRLVRELWRWLGAQEPQPLQRTGRCLSYGQGITYWPLGEILKEHLGILDSDGAQVVRARLGADEILGVALGLELGGDLHPIAVRDRFREAWVAFVEELSAERPLVLLLEDIHWGEEPLLDLVEQLVRRAAGPLLLLATARPELLERRPAWGGGRRNASLLWLEPLTTPESVRLVEEVVGGLPQRVRDELVRRGEGNPFFVEELVGTLVDRGLLRRSNGQWTVGDLPEALDIPDSVQAVLAARIDLLPPLEKAALQAASVIGREFWAGPVRAMLGGEDADFGLLEERDFVRLRPSSSIAGEREYAIKHALTREVAYASVPKVRRARLHAAFADWLEQIGDGGDEHAPHLAHHYSQAVSPDDADLVWTADHDERDRLRANALKWLRRAAALAVARYEIEEGLALLHTALALEPDHGLQAELWREVGRAHALKYDGEAFWSAMQQSLSVCVDRATCADTLGEVAFQTAVRSSMWQRRPDMSVVDEWIDRALELAAEDSPARVKALIARAFRDGAAQADAGRTASELADRLGDPELRGYAFQALAEAASASGKEAEAWQWAQRALSLLAEINDPDHRAERYWTALNPLVALGRLDEARAMAAEHAAIADQLTPHHRVHARALEILVDELAGEWQRITDAAPRVEHAVRANLATPCALNARSLLSSALAYAHLGQTREAERLERMADGLGMEGYELDLAPPRVLLAVIRRDRASLERLLEHLSPSKLDFHFVAGWVARLAALSELGERDRIESEAPALVRAGTLLEPFALRALGVARGDRELLGRAAIRFDDIGLATDAAATRELLRRDGGRIAPAGR